MADNIQTKDRNDADIDIAAKDIGGVKVPRNIIVDPAGNDMTLATQATLAALNVIAAAVQSAVEALNGKTTAVNTGAIAGTVALDAPTLAALETVSISGTVPVSASALPLPAGAATETTLAAVSGKLPTLSGGRIPVELPPGGGGLTDTELRAAAVPVSASALPLPTGAATEATLAARLPALTSTIPLDHSAGMPVRQIPADLWRCSFSDVGAGLQTADLTTLQTGAGQAISQSAGNLVLTSGTTANAETLIRSTRTFNGALQLRYKTILSQRIVNNNFSVELADLVGTALAYTINSATSVTVTFGSGLNPYSAKNVGQFVNLSVITGAAGIPGRFAIASTSGDTVTFTVAAWPATGSGTLMLWGWNYYRALYAGTTATNVAFDAQRKGWASGDSALTINTTASPGHVGHIQSNATLTAYSDALVATNAGYQLTPRGSRIENIPDDDEPLYLFLRCLNGTAAPASTTTWTVGFLSVEMTGRQKVYISGADQAGAPFAAAVQVVGGNLGTQAVSGTVTATVTGGTTLPVTPTTTFTESLATTNALAIKGSAGTLWSIVATNTNAAARFLKLYNLAVAPTVGTSVPVLTVGIPPGGSVTIDGGSNGIRFGTGIAIALTTLGTNADATAVAAGEIKVATSFT